jgi:hypothetical protein
MADKLSVGNSTVFNKDVRINALNVDGAITTTNQVNAGYLVVSGNTQLNTGGFSGDASFGGKINVTGDANFMKDVRSDTLHVDGDAYRNSGKKI